MEKILLLANIAATLFLTGVIWTTQLVQYPSFAYFNAETFTKHHDEYRLWITPIVAPPMIVELLTAILLLFYPPENIDSKLVWSGLILILIIWASTFFIQVPLHEKLARSGFDAQTITSLVNTNWIRTIAWSLRGALVLYFAWKIIRP
jgi:hypothetical protein